MDVRCIGQPIPLEQARPFALAMSGLYDPCNCVMWKGERLQFLREIVGDCQGFLLRYCNVHSEAVCPIE